MSANAIDILRLGATWIPRHRRIEIEYDDALAAVEALLEDMKRIERMAGAAGYGETPAKPIAEIASAAVGRVETGQ